ncbi:uncharacterized protein ACN2A1_002583 [Glossina fuscipes fuscipes]|nr:hypothetical protein GQX74_010721 [Glossina fuscipes]
MRRRSIYEISERIVQLKYTSGYRGTSNYYCGVVLSNCISISQGFQTANRKKISISEESKISIQNILREFQDDLQETDYEIELKDIKARISNKSPSLEQPQSEKD